MAILETNYTQEEVEKYISELNKVLRKDMVKNMLRDIFAKYINDKQWPMSYYQLRDDALPSVIGEDASRGLMWFILGGHVTPLDANRIFNNIDNENIRFINYLAVCYVENIYLAKRYADNPMGYHKSFFTFMNYDDKNPYLRNLYNLRIMRNDEENMTVSINSESVIKFAYDLLYYFNSMEPFKLNSLNDESRKNITELRDILNNIYKGDNNE